MLYRTALNVYVHIMNNFERMLKIKNAVYENYKQIQKRKCAFLGRRKML